MGFKAISQWLAQSEECTNEGCCPSDLAAKIAECAYYKAEKRGFAPGHEMEDWREAEQEILASDAEAES